jgi:hypothetical protein
VHRLYNATCISTFATLKDFTCHCHKLARSTIHLSSNTGYCLNARVDNLRCNSECILTERYTVIIVLPDTLIQTACSRCS